MATEHPTLDRDQIIDNAHELISSRRVEGAEVYNRQEERLGTIHSR